MKKKITKYLYKYGDKWSDSDGKDYNINQSTEIVLDTDEVYVYTFQDGKTHNKVGRLVKIFRNKKGILANAVIDTKKIDDVSSGEKFKTETALLKKKGEVAQKIGLIEVYLDPDTNN